MPQDQDQDQNTAVEQAPAEHSNAELAQRIEHERSVRAELAADKAAQQARAETLARENAEAQLLGAIESEAQKLGIEFEPDPKTLLKLLRVEPDLDIRSSDECFISGQRSSLAVIVDLFHRRHSGYVKSSLPLLQEKRDAEKFGAIKSLRDLPTREDRSAYISKFGLAAYESLCAGRAPTKSWTEMTTREYTGLTVAQKCRIISENGSDSVTRTLHKNDLADAARREAQRLEEIRRRR